MYREYTSAEEMLARYRDVRQKLYSVPPVRRVARAEPVPSAEDAVLAVQPIQANADREAAEAQERLRKAEGKLLEVSSVFRTKILIGLVQDVTGVCAKDICGPSRTLRFVKARQILFLLLRRFAGVSLPLIAKRVGRRDHTTVLHGLRKVEGLLAASTVPLESAREIAEFLWALDWIGNGQRSDSL